MFLRRNECYMQLRLPGEILVSRATSFFPRIGGVARETRVIRPFYSECSCHVLHASAWPPSHIIVEIATK